MNIAERFTRAVELLPDEVRARLDGDTPLDWAALESAGLSAEIGRAVAAPRLLPEPVETLVHRLVEDVGIVPGDVALGMERQGAAAGWLQSAKVEGFGESYQIRNERSGEVHLGVRTEAVAGYATIALELAAAIHDVWTRWMEAGVRHRGAPEDHRNGVAQCAVWMHARLGASAETNGERSTAVRLARRLEEAWNSQGADVRSALAGVRLSTARGARAPRRSYYAPGASHCLRACDIGEIRWLRALAERAAADRAGDNGRTAANGRERAANESRLAASGAIGGFAAEESGVLLLGTEPGRRMPDAEVAELEHAANHLPGAVRRRLGEAYGAGVGQALTRIQNGRDADALRTEMASSNAGERAPRWMEALAATVLKDAGAHTRGGSRTGSVRLEPGGEGERGYRGTDVETEVSGTLDLAGLIEQVRLGLVYANDAWSGLSSLQSAGREGQWTLGEAESGGRELTGSERETLESAQQIGLALDERQRAHADRHGERSPSALEQAAITAEALRSVGPTIRTAAGWPGAADAPDPRSSEDVAKVAVVAEALHGQIRTIANRLIAGWIAEVQAYGEGRAARGTSPPGGG